MSRPCTDCHPACACREAKFTRLIEVNKTLRTMIDDGSLAAAFINHDQASIPKVVSAFDALDQALADITYPL